MFLARDGKYHSGATKEERERADNYLLLADMLRQFRDFKIPPHEAVHLVGPLAAARFGPLIDAALRYVTQLKTEWEMA